MKKLVEIRCCTQASMTNQDTLFHCAAITNTGCKTVITKVITENTRLIPIRITCEDNVEWCYESLLARQSRGDGNETRNITHANYSEKVRMK